MTTEKIREGKTQQDKKGKSEISPLKKMEIVANTPEVMNCVKLLYSIMQEDPENFKCFMRLSFEIKGNIYELTFMRTIQYETDKIPEIKPPNPTTI